MAQKLGFLLVYPSPKYAISKFSMMFNEVSREAGSKSYVHDRC